MESRTEFRSTEESKSIVRVKIKFDVALDDCTSKTLNKVGLMLSQYGQALILANDPSKDTIEKNGECFLPFY